MAVKRNAPERRPRRLLPVAVAVAIVASVVLPAGATAATFPGERDSPPGQIYVWAGNVRQQLTVDLHAFKRLFGLVKAVRSRPAAFDGGPGEATAMPDVMIFNEVRPANIEIFRRLLLQRSKYQYEIISVEGAADRMVYNADRMTPQGLPQTIIDPCRSSGENARPYLLQRFTETASGSLVTVVGVHFKARYDETGQPGCREQNVQTVKTTLTADVGPVVVGGDFNKRPVEVEGACDPNEESPSLQWYQMMVAPADLSRAFIDTVRSVHRRTNRSMAGEWTFERLAESTICTGARTYKRSRLDYIFAAGVEVADAHADHPGWSESEPGAVRFGGDRYSDHRWVTARLILSGLPRVAVPQVDLAAGGRVQLTWEPVEGATTYAIYRAARANKFSKLGEVGAEQLTFEDRGEHGVPYRYAVAAIAADSSQGRESIGARAIPDARGPRVTATNPPAGAPSVEPRKRVRVWFGEGVDPEGVGENAIQLWREGERVAGRIRIESARQLSFDPARPLRKGSRFHVVVRSMLDRLGNDGPRYTFSFATPAPPPKKKGGKKN